VGLDLRGRIDRLAARVPPLRYLLAVLDRYGDLHGNVAANSITLMGFLALFAVTLLAVAVVGYLDRANVDVAAGIARWLGLTGDAADVVTRAVGTARRSARFATVIGFLGVLTIGTSFAYAVASAYDIAWGVRGRGLIDRLRGLVWLAGAGVLGAVGIYATALWSRADVVTTVAVMALTLSANTALWLFTSWWLPNRRVTFRSMLPAAVTGAVLLEVLKVVGGIWVPHLVTNASELWGAIGAVFALIAWILFFGRVVVYVTVVEVLEAERRGDKAPPVRAPEPGGDESGEP
jgi:membrane protein